MNNTPNEADIIKAAQQGPYARVLIRDDDDGYAAEVIEFPGCYSGGDSAEEAMSNLDEAIELWVGATLDEGLEIPPPLLNADFSGRVTLRLLPSIHERASILAGREGVSLNRFLSNAVSYYVGYLTAVTSKAQRRAELPGEQPRAEQSPGEQSRGYAIAEDPPEGKSER